MLYPEDKIFQNRNTAIDNQNQTNSTCKMLKEVDDWLCKHIDSPDREQNLQIPGLKSFARVSQDVIDGAVGTFGKTIHNPAVVGTWASMIYQMGDRYKRNDGIDAAKEEFDNLDRFACKFIGQDSFTAKLAEKELAEIHKLRNSQEK